MSVQIPYLTEIIAGIAIIVVLIICWFIYKKFRKHRHKHHFIPMQAVVIQDKSRLVMVCRKCDRAIHVPIITRKQLQELEGQ